jgi:hypothetical protein
VSDRFNHIEIDKSGQVSLFILSSTGKAKKVPLAQEDLATIITDIGAIVGVIMSADKKRATNWSDGD